MTLFRYVWLVQVWLFLGFITLSLSSCERSGLNPGDFAPDFSLPLLNGDRVSLSDYRGRVVLLNFWASWCPPCLEEMPGLQSLYTAIKDKGFLVVAVASRDEEENARAMVDRLKLTFPILLDPDGTNAARYKTTGFPESFIIDGSGRIVMIHDPSELAPTARIVGPRKWDTSMVREELIGLISELSHRS